MGTHNDGAAPSLVISGSDAELLDSAVIIDASSTAPEQPVRASDALPSLTGTDRYQTGPVIGRGGMGEVLLQVDRNIGRAVAKKMLHPEMHREVSLQRFVREARVQGQLEHPSVVPVHDFGVDLDGRVFFTMKRVRGKTLAEILERLAAKDPEEEARFSRHKLLSALVQICLAVDYAHNRGVIHRDLKPTNIMLGDFGEVYVLDWGLAKLTTRAEADDLGSSQADGDPSTRADMTTDGDFIGTPLYMAPEQLRGKHGSVDARSDVFALGTILFEILTLRPLRAGSSLGVLLGEADVTAAVERASHRATDVPSELDDLCAAALERDPEKRLPSARALSDAITRYLEGDRDLVARRTQAALLLRDARARLQGPRRATEVVLAMRQVLEALALSPADEDAQRLLVSLMLEGTGELSPEASRAFEEGDVEVRRAGFRRGTAGLVLWLCTLPAAIFVGVRDWPVVLSIVALTLLAIAVAALLARSKVAARSRVAPLVLAFLSALIAALGSGWLGPFVLMPVAACAASTMFLMHGTREEAPGILAVWIAVILATFGAEWLHLVPPAYTFSGGDLVLHARLLHLPELPTLACLAYTTVSFVGFLGYFVAQLRGKQRDAERRLFGQAWLLQQLFPSGGRSKA